MCLCTDDRNPLDIADEGVALLLRTQWAEGEGHLEKVEVLTSDTVWSLREKGFDAWGVDFDASRAVGDLQYGIGSGTTRHVGIISVPPAGFWHTRRVGLSNANRRNAGL